MLAAYVQQQNQTTSITVGRGAAAGLLAGIIGAMVWLVAAIAVDVVMAPLQQRVVGEVLRNADDMPPEARAWLRMLTDRGSATLRYLLGFMFHVFAGAIFATLGGILGTVFFRPGPRSAQA
jgi:hypothetical protein